MTRLGGRGMRPRHAKRRLPLEEIKDAILEDLPVEVKLGLVTAEDASSHFAIEEGDLLIEVALVPNEERVTCRMGAVGGGSGQGIWYIPPVGSEVLVSVPDGELECGPVIVGVLSSGALPEGVAEGIVVIAAETRVHIHDGTEGGIEPLVLKSEYDALKAAYDGHVHPIAPAVVVGSVPPVAPPATPFSILGASTLTTGPAPAAPGTQTLNSK